MQSLKGTFSLLGIILMFSSCGSTQTQRGPSAEMGEESLSILIYSKTNGYRHKSIPSGIAAINKMAKENNWKTTETEDSLYFRNENLSKHKVIVFLNTTMDVLGSKGEKAFISFINNGGGFVGIHAACDTEYDWPWYHDFIGAHFQSHPKTQEARLIVNKENPSPSIAHLGEEWNINDEWYYFTKPVEKQVIPLLWLDESSIEGKESSGWEHPIAWYHYFEGGRMFYTGLGHTNAMFANPDYLEHLKQGILWAGDKTILPIITEWEDLLDVDLSKWDKFIGVPHKTIKVEGNEGSENGTTGTPLGFNNDPTEVFKVIKESSGEKVLHISGEIYGGLSTKEIYENYHFTCEFKWGDKKWEPRLERKRDNGILYHCTGVQGSFWNVWMRSLEFQVQEGDMGDFYPLAGTIAEIRTSSGPENKLYDPDGEVLSYAFLKGYPQGRGIRSLDMEKPHREWNKLDLYVVGNKSMHVVNGKVVLALENTRYIDGGKEISLRKGKIQLQSEAAESYYKNVMIKSISDFPAEIKSQAKIK